MTTIAYKNGVIACDKQVTDDHVIGSITKWVEDDDTVYLMAGTLTVGLRFIEWLQGESDLNKPPKLKDTTVFAFDRQTGKLSVWESRWVPLVVEESLYTNGSGGTIALGAMAAGCDPAEAVKIASKYDAYSGKGVKVWTSKKAARVENDG